jgi:uncharacterized protein YjiS (DUF1127 family)
MFGTIIRRVRMWKKVRYDAFRLRGLDDHLLEDIGVEREAIGDFVRGRLRRD